MCNLHADMGLRDEDIAPTTLGSNDSDTFCIGRSSFESGTFDHEDADHFLELRWLQHE